MPVTFVTRTSLHGLSLAALSLSVVRSPAIMHDRRGTASDNEAISVTAVFPSAPALSVVEIAQPFVNECCAANIQGVENAPAVDGNDQCWQAELPILGHVDDIWPRPGLGAHGGTASASPVSGRENEKVEPYPTLGDAHSRPL